MDGREIYSVATGTQQLKIYSLSEQRFVKSIALRSDGAVIVGGNCLTHSS